MSDWLHLKSGSDIRGVAVDTPDAPVTLTPEIGMAVGQVFAGWLASTLPKDKETLTIAVGCDSRVTGETLKAAMMEGLLSAGAKVYDCGLCTTPAMFMSTVLLGCDGAVMVTASHLPWNRNGYKFFTPQGGLDGADITDILTQAASVQAAPTGMRAEKADLLARYSEFLKSKITDTLGEEQPLAGLHIVVDAGNGAGGFYADMLASLGADIGGSQFLEPDGHFPSHIPNPEDATAMASIGDAVRRAGADIGVLFDADCDRAAMVGPDGAAINRNRLIALVAAMLLRETPGITIVTDSVVSAGLDRFIQARGGVLHRFKRGYRNVIDEAIRLNAEGVDCPLAMETSGHAALRENHFLDDGMYLVTRLIIQAQQMRRDGGQLTGLIDALEMPLEAIEIRLTILAKDFRGAGTDILSGIIEGAKRAPHQSIDPQNREGVRILYGTPDSWALLRLSLHDPLLVINAESGEEGGLARILASLYTVLAPYTELDLSALKAHIV